MRLSRKYRIGIFACAALLALFAGVFACVAGASIQRAYAEDGVLVVAIDPGHGGTEEGAFHYNISEKERNWKIANAVVDELNTYSGVRAVLTKSYDDTLDREQRIIAAKKLGADVVVSIHCDSVDDASVRGASIIIPNKSAYLYEETHVLGERLGNSIFPELEALGLVRRGIYTRDCTDGETYPAPGGICDWYGINYWARWNGLCGIIIEHGFLSNAEEAARLASDAFCKQLGVADATGIAKCYGLSKASDVTVGEAVSTPIQTDVAQVRFNVADTPDGETPDGTTAFVDGMPQTIVRDGDYATVAITGSGPHVITMYGHNKVSSDPHEVYPTSTCVWLVTSNGSAFTAQRHYRLDKALQYAGSSIRVTGNRGIRMITGMDVAVKSALVTSGIGGFTLKETGTVIAWSKNVENEGLTLASENVRSGTAYVAGKQDPVFAVKDGTSRYTNVLVGFSLSQCTEDLTMCPYAVLANKAGEQVVLYGGCVQRSIQYIASQNADAFAKGTNAYNYIQELINAK